MKMELLVKYSGITAIIVYSLLLWAFLSWKKTRRPAETSAVEEVRQPEKVSDRIPLDENDEDAVVAALVASIDFRQENKTDVRILSVREVK